MFNLLQCLQINRTAMIAGALAIVPLAAHGQYLSNIPGHARAQALATKRCWTPNEQREATELAWQLEGQKITDENEAMYADERGNKENARLYRYRASTLAGDVLILRRSHKSCPEPAKHQWPGAIFPEFGMSSTPNSALGATAMQFFAGLEGGFGGAKASYDDLIIDPKSFVGGAFMGVRIPQPNQWFVGAQAGFFATNLTREAARDFTVGLEWGLPLDVQVGTTVQTGLSPMPVTLYVYVGPMIGITRVTSAGVTDHFTLFGVTAGAGAEVNVTQHWALGAKVRWFNLDPSDAKSQGQHVDGVIGTISAMYKF